MAEMDERVRGPPVVEEVARPVAGVADDYDLGARGAMEKIRNLSRPDLQAFGEL